MGPGTLPGKPLNLQSRVAAPKLLNWSWYWNVLALHAWGPSVKAPAGSPLPRGNGWLPYRQHSELVANT